MLIDLSTNRVLLQQNVHTPLPPGSLTKILTAMIAYDWLPHDSQIAADATAAAVTPERIGMVAGQKWPFSMTMQALLVYSANDAAYALAEKVGGSLAGFVPIMQYAAAQIGMRDHPVLRDPAGLDGTEGFDGGNRISAWDLATAGRDLMANPALAAIVAMKKLAFTAPNGTVYGLHNQNLYFLNTFPGAIGVKTGYTDRAGFCVVEEADRGGRRMMAVVLNGKNSYQTAAYLLNEGFALPAAAEPPHAPGLPPIVEPELLAQPVTPPSTVASLLPSPSATTPTVTAPVVTAPAGTDRPAKALAANTTAATSSPNPYVLGGTAAGLVAVGGVSARTWRRRRARPAGAHSPKTD